MDDARDAITSKSVRGGDADAFAALVDRLHGSLSRFARLLAPDEDAAARAVRSTWHAAIEGLDRLPGETALRPWLYRLLIESVDTELDRHARVEPAVPVDAFEAEGDLWAGHWAGDVERWDGQHDNALLEQTVHELPPTLAAVVVLRDVDRLPSPEVQEILGFDDDDLRILLHQARTTIRAKLDATAGARA